MDARAHFRNCCSELGIDMDARFLLCPRTDDGNRQNFQYTCRQKKKDSHRYAVKFFKNAGFYIAWNLKTPLSQKEVFFIQRKSVLAKVDSSKKERIFTVNKHIGVNGSEDELVYVFYPETVKLFLNRYVVNR